MACNFENCELVLICNLVFVICSFKRILFVIQTYGFSVHSGLVIVCTVFNKKGGGSYNR